MNVRRFSLGLSIAAAALVIFAAIWTRNPALLLLGILPAGLALTAWGPGGPK